MIIYPAIILVLLIVAFGIILRRAYIIESEKNPESDLTSFEKNKDATDLAHQEVNPFREKEENFVKAEELFKKKQFISAEKWYIEAVQKNPKNPIIFSRLAVIYLEQKNYKDAIDSLNEAIKLNPGSAVNYFNLSFAYNEEGDKREAINSAKKAIRLDPKNSKYKKWLEQLRIKPF